MNESDQRIYPCAECGKLRSKAEGGAIFTACVECWDKKHIVYPEFDPKKHCIDGTKLQSLFQLVERQQKEMSSDGGNMVGPLYWQGALIQLHNAIVELKK